MIKRFGPVDSKVLIFSEISKCRLLYFLINELLVEAWSQQLLDNWLHLTPRLGLSVVLLKVSWIVGELQ